MTREDVQERAIHLFRKYKRLALQWSTGLGKSKAAIEIIRDLEDRMNDKATILLVVAEIAHKNNWIKEFDKWGYNNLPYIGITIETYASLKKHKGERYDLIILDEGHHAGSDLRLNILSDIKADNVLILSATLPDDTLSYLISIYGGFYTYKVTLKEAIEAEILPEPEIHIIPMTLDNTKKDQVVIESWGKSGKRVKMKCDMRSRWDIIKNKAKYPNVDLHISCTALEKYNWINGKFEYWKSRYFRTRNEAVKNKWLQYGSLRKRFLGELKTDCAKYLIAKELKDKRYICFCSSIDQAELLGKDKAIHSNRKDSLSVIEDFNNKKINSLYAVGMIQEGQNLVDIDAGVIIQLDGVDRAFIQKCGRVLRAKEPTLYILYFKNTKDEEYLKNVSENTSPEYINEIEAYEDNNR